MNSRGPKGNKDGGKPNTFLEGLKLFVFIVMVAFLAFVTGGLTTSMKTAGIDGFMQRLAMVSTYLYEASVNEAVFDPFWKEAHMPGSDTGSPVVLHDATVAADGYNLIVSAQAQEAWLIDMDGNSVHKWARRFDEIWSNPPQLPEYEKDGPEYWADRIYWRRAHLYPNGDLLVIYETPYRTPYGLGLAKLDKDSNVIWKVDANVHHDTAIEPTGTIYILGQKINETGYPGLDEITPPFIDDSVVVISPDGKIERQISIIEAFLNSDYAPLLATLNINLRGDVMHANTVQYIDGATAGHFAFAKEGDLLISMREMNVIAVLDPDLQRITWAQTGLWKGQHEPVALDNGHILLFDNRGNRGGGSSGKSRIIEYDPVKGSIGWSYKGTAEAPFHSAVYGSVQRLSNGNTMIVESTNGRTFEVTESGRIVWEYRSPHRKSHNGKESVVLLMDAVRFEAGALQFLE